MERFYVSGIPVKTSKCDFESLLTPYEAFLVPSKLDPTECRGFGYITIDKKKRSSVLKLLRTQYGPDVLLQKPKSDPRNIIPEVKKVATKSEDPKPKEESRNETSKKSGKDQKPLVSKNLKTFDSDSDEPPKRRRVEADSKLRSKRIIDETKGESSPSSSSSSSKRLPNRSEEAGKVEVEVQRQKDILSSMFDVKDSVKEKPKQKSSLVVPRFDPTASSSAPKSEPPRIGEKSESPKSEPPRITEKSESPITHPKSEPPRIAEKSESLKNDSEPLKMIPETTGQQFVNPVFKDVFKPREVETAGEVDIGSSWLSSLVAEPAKPAKTPDNWMTTLSRTKSEDVKLVELLPFWRRASEDEIRESWSASKAWYAWDLKKKHKHARSAKIEKVS